MKQDNPRITIMKDKDKIRERKINKSNYIIDWQHEILENIFCEQKPIEMISYFCPIYYTDNDNQNLNKPV